jgi:hypothetical protein
MFSDAFQTFDEDFNIRHPVFHWLFRVSHNWGGIIELIPSMREHLLHTGYLHHSTPAMRGSSRGSVGDEEDTSTSYSAVFREMFCVTAQDIARSMKTRLQDLGHLYESVETTGTLLNARTLFINSHEKPIIAAEVAEQKDVEAGVNPIMLGRGQLLVLTRQVSTAEGSRLQDSGFRFASFDQIGDNLARSLQISRDDLQNLMGRLQPSSTRRLSLPQKGTYLTSFLLQPSPVIDGLDVIVQKRTPDQLPMVNLADEQLTTREMKILSTFNGNSLHNCLHRISQQSGPITEDVLFLDKFRDAIQQLVHQVPEPALRQASFSAQQLEVAHGMTNHNEPLQATTFAFVGIREVYNQSLQSPMLQCVPLSFFRAKLRSYVDCPDHAILAHKNHKEFGSLHSSTIDVAIPPSKKATKWNTLFRTSTTRSSYAETINADNSSEKGLVNTPSIYLHGANANATTHPFGGILISKDVVVSEDHKDGRQIELKELGFRTEAGVADTEQPTVADRLMAITTSFSRVLPKDHHHGRR